MHRETNPRHHALISSFEPLTGCPVVVNTSLGVRGVCTPAGAFRCLMGTEIEFRAAGNSRLEKEDQNAALKQNYEHAFALD